MMSQLNGIPSPETKRRPRAPVADIAVIRTVRASTQAETKMPGLENRSAAYVWYVRSGNAEDGHLQSSIS